MVMIRMGIVTDLVKSREPKTAKELSVSCGGDELLIGMPALEIPYTLFFGKLTLMIPSQDDETASSFGCFP